MNDRSAFATGSVSVNLYAYDDLGATARAAAVVADALVAERAGFDGITVSEHHGGTPGYFPAPISVATWVLEHTSSVFVAAMPVVLPLRPTAAVIEEVAWLSARHPGRVGLGVAPGYSHDDFELFDVDFDQRIERYAASMSRLSNVLGGRTAAADPLASDPAVALLPSSPVPVVSAAGSVRAARRAARAGCGLVFGSHSTPQAVGRMVSAHHADAGEELASVLGRRVWVGAAPPGALSQQFALYQRLGRGNAPWSAGTQEEQVVAGPADQVVDHLVHALHESRCTALSMRVHVPGCSPELVRTQLKELGQDVLPSLRAQMETNTARLGRDSLDFRPT